MPPKTKTPSLPLQSRILVHPNRSNFQEAQNRNCLLPTKNIAMDLDKKLGNAAPPDRVNGNGPSQGRRQMGVARACSSTLMAKGRFSTGFSTNIVIANVVRKLFLQLVLKDNRIIDLLWNHGFFVRPPACDSRCPLVLKCSLAPRPALLCPALPTPLANWPLTSFTQQEPPTGPASPTRRPSTPGSQLQSGSPHPGDFDTISCDVPPAQEVAVACRY